VPVLLPLYYVGDMKHTLGTGVLTTATCHRDNVLLALSKIVHHHSIQFVLTDGTDSFIYEWRDLIGMLGVKHDEERIDIGKLIWIGSVDDKLAAAYIGTCRTKNRYDCIMYFVVDRDKVTARLFNLPKSAYKDTETMSDLPFIKIKGVERRIAATVCGGKLYVCAPNIIPSAYGRKTGCVVYNLNDDQMNVVGVTDEVEDIFSVIPVCARDTVYLVVQSMVGEGTVTVHRLSNKVLEEIVSFRAQRAFSAFSDGNYAWVIATDSVHSVGLRSGLVYSNRSFNLDVDDVTLGQYVGDGFIALKGSKEVVGIGPTAEQFPLRSFSVYGSDVKRLEGRGDCAVDVKSDVSGVYRVLW